MNLDDVVYLLLLFLSVFFGYYYRTISDTNSKKLLGSAAGLCIIIIVSGVHIIHPLLVFFINAIIILHGNRRNCHLISFAFSFIYLFFFRTTAYLGIPYPPGHTNLIQMILTLKLVGLAFEVNADYSDQKVLGTKYQNDRAVKSITFMDIMHYSFSYIGILTGPFYRYRTYVDSMELPFARYANWKEATMKKIRFVPLYALLFLIGDFYWPVSYATTPEFFDERSWLYRQWYVWPNFFLFRMRIYIGMVLSECVCVTAGLGAYPSFTKPKPGEGPTERTNDIKDLCKSEDKLQETVYNYNTILNINPHGAEFTPTYRQAIKNWNICVQYWLAVNVYKRFPSKKYRTAVTMLVSAFWHGVYTGYYVCIGTVPFVLLLEGVYLRLYDVEKNKFMACIHWFFRMHTFSYQAIAFLLLDLSNIFHYYNSVYHFTLVVYIILYIVGVYLVKSKKKDKKVA